MKFRHRVLVHIPAAQTAPMKESSKIVDQRKEEDSPALPAQPDHQLLATVLSTASATTRAEDKENLMMVTVERVKQRWE